MLRIFSHRKKIQRLWSGSNPRTREPEASMLTTRPPKPSSNGRNSVTVQNLTHVYMKFFHHKDLGSHLLQLCPKVVKHPVYDNCYVFSSLSVGRVEIEPSQPGQLLCCFLFVCSFCFVTFLHSIKMHVCVACDCRSQWPRVLRRRSMAARLLRSWVRIPPGAWMSVCCDCCMLSGRGLCDEMITRPVESYRLWCVSCVI
jgi:hypothetical protein